MGLEGELCVMYWTNKKRKLVFEFDGNGHGDSNLIMLEGEPSRKESCGCSVWRGFGFSIFYFLRNVGVGRKFVRAKHGYDEGSILEEKLMGTGGYSRNKPLLF